MAQTNYIQGVMKNESYSQSSPTMSQDNQMGQKMVIQTEGQQISPQQITKKEDSKEPLIKPKGKKRPVPQSQKDELYWERVSLPLHTISCKHSLIATKEQSCSKEIKRVSPSS